MGATDLLPHAHEHPSGKRVLLTVAGFAGILLTSLALAYPLARSLVGSSLRANSRKRARASSSGPSGSSSA